MPVHVLINEVQQAYLIKWELPVYVQVYGPPLGQVLLLIHKKCILLKSTCEGK